MDNTFSKLISRRDSEQLDDAILESRFADLQAILVRTQRNQGERLWAQAGLQTLEAERNRRLARLPRLKM